jgi:uncharacterized iron-regulated membrane protein
MKINKKLFFKIHSWIGIKLSILFFIVCFSGTLATVSHELDWLFNPSIRATPQETLASKNIIINNIKEKYPDGKLTYIGATPEPYLCNIAYVSVNNQSRYVFVNQYTGEVQGEAKLTIQRYLRDLHYFLFIPFQVGHFTVLIFGFMLFISTVTALFFYKKWWRKLFDLKTGKGPVVLFRSLHRLVGVWSIPFTILFSITGIWYFLERTNIASISETANTKTPIIEEIAMDSAAFSQIHYNIDYDSVVQAAQSAIPNLVVKDIAIPRNKTSPIYLTGKSDVALVRNRANRIYIHPITYEVVGIQNAKDISTVTWLNDIADPLHFGYWGGMLTKILWFFGGLAISFLVGTGIWISLKRKIKDAKKAKAQQLGKWKYPNILIMILMFGFMYYILFSRYSVNVLQFSIITVSWISTIYLSWLIYVKKINKTKH